MFPIDFDHAVIEAQKSALAIIGKAIDQGSLFETRAWIVPIYGGMTSIDWRRLEADSIELARAQEERILERARGELAGGASETAVAHTFGYSRPFVHKLNQALKGSVRS